MGTCRGVMTDGIVDVEPGGRVEEESEVEVLSSCLRDVAPSSTQCSIGNWARSSPIRVSVARDALDPFGTTDRRGGGEVGDGDGGRERLGGAVDPPIT